MKPLFIINEEDYIQKVIESEHKPDTLSIKRMVTMLCRYFYKLGIKPKELSYTVCKQLEKIMNDDENFRPYEVADLVYATSTKIIHGKIPKELKVRDYIPVYKDEMKVLDKLKSQNEKKLMFTMYVLARYFDHHGWISLPLEDVISLSNVKCSNKKKYEIIRGLIDQGLISINMKASSLLNVCIKGYNIKHDAECYRITEISNLGEYYLLNTSPNKYVRCNACGKSVQKKSNRTSFCNKCINDRKRKQNAIAMKLSRELQLDFI